MKRPTKSRIKEIIEHGSYASRSLNPVGQLERFAERIMDEIEKINQPNDKEKVDEVIKTC